MNEALMDALKVSAIGLPVMFGVLTIFIILSHVLIKLFPDKSSTEER